jgi:hypothetical protein
MVKSAFATACHRLHRSPLSVKEGVESQRKETLSSSCCTPGTDIGGSRIRCTRRDSRLDSIAAKSHLSQDDGSFGLIVEGAGEDDRAMTFTTGTSAYARPVGRCRRRLSAAHADAAVEGPVAVGDADAGDLDVALSA